MGKKITGSKTFHSLRKLAQFLQNSLENGIENGAKPSLFSVTYTKNNATTSNGNVNKPARDADAVAMLINLAKNDSMTITDVADRYRVMLQKSMDFIFIAGLNRTELRPALENFALSILELLAASLASVTEATTERSRLVYGWENLAYICQDCIRLHFSHLLTHILAPKVNFRTRSKAIQTLTSQSRMHSVLSYCAKRNKPIMYRFGIFLHEFRYHYKDITEKLIMQCDFLLEGLDSCGINTLPPPEDCVPEWSVVREEKQAWQAESAKIAKFVEKRFHAQDLRFLDKHKMLYDQIKAEGNRITSQIVEMQNERRKQALQRVKNSQCKRIKFTHFWKDIVELVTHEKATWYFPNAYPRGWKLDSTEGPLRIRKRMVRCKLNIDTKFFLPYYSSRHNSMKLPLQDLLVDKEVESALTYIIESINEDEEIIHTSHASFIAPTVEQKGEFLISYKHLYFIGEESSMKNGANAPNVVSRYWPLDVVREIHLRRYRLKNCALELFSTMGQSALLAFANEQEREEVRKTLLKLNFPNMKSKTTLGEYTSLWRDGCLTNFEYLTQLNKLAGRSFNDLMQYPVFPFICCNYKDNVINLDDSSNYRNLKKPIPIQKEEKEEHFKRNYESSSQMCDDGPYHYGSHYSNSGIVLYYLIRVPPFTQLFLHFQDGNFDVPDRSFHTLETTWRLASSDSTTAIRELIPEFFFLPETFINTQGFKFGIRQNGERVNHVKLPPWCSEDPRKFVLIHRAMLESAHVTRNIQHWVDLVFGYKQTGKAAVEAINVFHPATYFGYDADADGDLLNVEARRTMVRTYGQTPLQLFSSSHPSPSLNSFEHLKTVSNKNVPQVLKEVEGIPWGIYAGSPADSKPSIHFVLTLQTNVRSMMSISPNEVMLLAPNTVVYTLKTRKDVPTLLRYIISWNHSDGILRCRRNKDTAVYPLISLPLYNKVNCCVISQKQLWIGTESGQVLVYIVSAMNGKGDLVANTPNHPLTAHTDAVTCLTISNAFKVCFSGGKDGVVVLWDTNRLTYIRSVTVFESSICHLAVSETLGDWISVTYSQTKEISVIRYYTINAEFIDSVNIDSEIKCVTFSNAPEGRNVNVIAVGLADRSIRLFSTWDLRQVRILSTDKAKEPAICLHYTEDNLKLCMMTESQRLLVWETSQVKSKLPKFITTGGN